MKKTIAVLILLTSCSPSEPAPMSGLCVDRVAPNLFDAASADVSFKECMWQSQKWLCRLESGSNAWRCVAITRNRSEDWPDPPRTAPSTR